MKEKILVVEDAAAILTGLVDLLSGEGYAVEPARDGEKALAVFRCAKFDLVLLDIMIPRKSGYEVCREIRKADAAVPVIMLTAKGQEVDKVVGLELGADDYIVKPFGVNELLARIRSVLRRSQAQPAGKKSQEPFSFGSVTVHPKTLMAVTKRGQVALTARELHLLEVFAARPHEVIDRNTLLDEVWGIKYEGTTRTLDQHIAKLRQKIEDDPSDPKYILTVHGTGYRFLQGATD